MRDEIRERWFTPFLLPVTVIGVILVIGLSLSRVLLAVSELGASFVALLAAGYIMAMAFFVEARKRISARWLGIAMAVGLIGLVGAGTVAAAAGMRPMEEHGAEGGGEGGGGGEATASEPIFVAIDIAYESAPEELPTGNNDLELVNNGAIEHTVVFEELNDEKVLDAVAGETDSASVDLDAGEYTYYCSVPGHREAGMEGTLTVSDAAGAGTGGGGGGASSEEAASEAGSEGGAAEGASAAASEG
jgi:plastocyanin